MTLQEINANDSSGAQSTHNEPSDFQPKEQQDLAHFRSAQKTECPTGGFNHLRYVIIMMAGMACGAMLFLRLSFSIAIITMVNRTAIWENSNVTFTTSQQLDDYVEVGEFVWTNEIQQTILSGYMVAYTVPQFFTTRWTLKYGLRRSIPVALSICALSILLTPISAYWGWEWVLALRLLNGLGASPMFPNMMNTVEIWARKDEKTLGLMIAQFSCNFIYTSTPLISGYLTSLHWTWSFYVPAFVVLFYCLVWYLIVADTPATSTWISDKERVHLLGPEALTTQGATGDSAREDKIQAGVQLPWYFMFRIPQFYPLLVLWILYCSTGGAFTFLTPQYLRRILDVPVKEIGLMSFTTIIGSLFCMLWPGPMTAFLRRSLGLSLTVARKTVTTCCIGIAVITFSYLGYAHSNLIPTIVINRFFHQTNDTLFMATIMSKFGKAGVSGLVYSMSNSIGNLATVFLCWAIGIYLDKYGESLGCWSGVMYSLAAMNTIYAIVYLICCSSEPVRVKAIEDRDEGNDSKC